MTLYKTVHGKFASHQLKRSLLRQSEFATKRRTSSRVRSSHTPILLLTSPKHVPRARVDATVDSFHSIGTFGDYDADKGPSSNGRIVVSREKRNYDVLISALCSSTFHVLVAVFVFLPSGAVFLWLTAYSQADCRSPFWLRWGSGDCDEVLHVPTTFDQRVLWCTANAVVLTALLYALLRVCIIAS